MNLLIVDKTQTIVYRVKSLVRQLDVNVFDAQTETGAYYKAKELKGDVDLLIIDINLGSEDSYAIIKILKQVCPKVHVVILTSQNKKDAFITCMQLGAVDYILKPFDDSYLKSKLIKHVMAIASKQNLLTSTEYSYADIQNFITKELKKAIEKRYEMNIMAILFLKDPRFYNISSENELNIIRKNFKEFMNKKIQLVNTNIRYGQNGYMFALPNSRNSEKSYMKLNMTLIIEEFLTQYNLKNFIYLLEVFNLPNDVSYNENVLDKIITIIEGKVDKISSIS